MIIGLLVILGLLQETVGADGWGTLEERTILTTSVYEDSENSGVTASNEFISHETEKNISLQLNIIGLYNSDKGVILLPGGSVKLWPWINIGVEGGLYSLIFLDI